MHLTAMDSPIENCQEIDADEVHLLEVLLTIVNHLFPISSVLLPFPRFASFFPHLPFITPPIRPESRQFASYFPQIRIVVAKFPSVNPTFSAPTMSKHWHTRPSPPHSLSIIFPVCLFSHV